MSINHKVLDHIACTWQKSTSVNHATRGANKTPTNRCQRFATVDIIQRSSNLIYLTVMWFLGYWETPLPSMLAPSFRTSTLCTHVCDSKCGSAQRSMCWIAQEGREYPVRLRIHVLLGPALYTSQCRGIASVGVVVRSCCPDPNAEPRRSKEVDVAYLADLRVQRAS